MQTLHLVKPNHSVHHTATQSIHNKPISTKPIITVRRRTATMPANVAAIWGAFLYEGLLVCTKDPARGSEILRCWILGRDELIAEVCAYLPELWKQMEPRWYERDFPSVFESSVVVSLGVSLGDYLLLNHGELPSRELFREWASDFINDFFQQGVSYA